MARRSNQPKQIIEAMDHEARHILRTTRLDLDAWLALPGETRAARWRAWDAAAKADCVIQLLTRRYGEWCQADVDAAIAEGDRRYGAGLTDVEGATVDALDRLAGVTDGRQRNAYRGAKLHFLGGARPALLPDGAWTVPSASGGPAHVMTRLPGGRWGCTCKAGAAAHWAIALMEGFEAGLDALATADREPDAAPAAPAPLGARIAAARALAGRAA